MTPDRTVIHYCATPYTRYCKGWHGAYIDACKVSARLRLKYKIHIFCPISHCHGMTIHGDLPAVDHGYWEDSNLPFIDFCGGLIVAKLEGWDQSIGIAGEIHAFKAAHKPILYCDPETLELAA